MSTQIREVECKRCHYKWFPKTPNKPGTCAKCRSKYWKTERKRFWTQKR